MPLVLDANVLIDYAKTDESILALFAEHAGPVHVPMAVLDEVEQLDLQNCSELGLILTDGTVAQLTEAGKGTGRLSFADRLCLILARDQGWTLVTNDTALRRACTAAGVEVRWGLQILLDLIGSGDLSMSSAIEAAEAIRQINPRHVSESILERFRRLARESGGKVDQAVSGKGG